MKSSPATTYRVPFNRPCVMGSEFEHMASAVNTRIIGASGTFSAKCERMLETELGIPHALLTTSCTHSLEIAALLLDLKAGDEVILPAYTFVSCANAFALRGARLVFADIRPDTLNIDESKIEGLITSKTKAILVVHYAGVGCEMTAIMEIARRRGVAVIEDNAHGLFGKYKDSYLGTFGCVSALSFHETKNFTCGEGGALIANDSALAARAEIICDKGTDRARLFRGEIDKYTWLDLGSSYRPADILAAFLYGQLEKRAEIWADRKRVWDYYFAELADWAAANGYRVPLIPPYCTQGYHMFYLLVDTLERRQALLDHLRKSGIHAVFHYVPLHLSKMGKSLGHKVGDFPVAEKISDCLIRLPFYNSLGETEQAFVVQALKGFKPA